MPMRVRIDIPKSGSSEIAARFRAIVRTLDGLGVGEVLVSRRVKRPGEKGRALHGRAIANMLKAQGRDPFAYPPAETTQQDAQLTRGVLATLSAAYRARRHQAQAMKALILATSQAFADWSIAALKEGRIGSNSKGVAAIKKRLIKQGILSSKYGDPPPYGVRTGRFLEGIRARWRRGGGGATGAGRRVVRGR